ncbi:MAG: 50S ribosome-binding GTPase [Sphingobacterium sp.]|jgi:sulfate adenylyltransferase subunit 1|uniref:sulfate adenylyltransferase subunit 1 n=1 Tax=Sphingobacterium sp. TaxID=341027 RepID=UPI00284945D0|nr:GTP-binding protein [Sphingobacterium sp.]MDR3006431.1 50S ribosome-binding GTPase [Sphingobacterium sp.]
MNILKFITAGSVDDGKSTLIGRLLYDTNSILDDQLEAIQRANRKNDDGTVDLAILTDGLKAEREQGITIDVAYKYFQTDHRKYIIADAPGHIQYTRNMVTGASNSDLIIILVDARKGVIEQTKRHSFIAKLLAMKQILVCINKMDMVDYSATVFEQIKSDYLTLASNLGLKDVDFIPVSALKGDNIVHKSDRMLWYTGESLLDYLENVEIHEHETANWRFPVQWVVRPQTDDLHDYRGYAGRVLGEGLTVGDPVIIYPAETFSTVKAIELNGLQLQRAESGQSVIIHLSDDVDISRGDTIASVENPPKFERNIQANLCWFDNKPLDTDQIYLVQSHSKLTKVKIVDVLYKFDINTQEKVYNEEIKLNDIGRIAIKSAENLVFDLQNENAENSQAIVIDPRTNLTVGALMIQAVD